MRANLGWRAGDWNVQAFLNHTGSYRNNTVSPVQVVDSNNTVDLHIAYTVGEHAPVSWAKGMVLSLDANNLFDKDPPFVNINGGYDPQTVSPMGRLIAVNISKRW